MTQEHEPLSTADLARTEEMRGRSEEQIVDRAERSGIDVAEKRRTPVDNAPAVPVPAVEQASRRFPLLTWVVANADRRLPIQDSSVDVVLSIHGRRNAAECSRVLKPNGILIVVLPAPDDLIELRTVVQGEGVERDRIDTMVAEHATTFKIVERLPIREQLTLERDALLNLLRGTYRGARFKLSERVEAMQQMDVTLSSEMCVLRKA